MYIEDVITETLNVSAEDNPDEYINKPSKNYEKLHNIIQNFMKESTEENYTLLKDFCEQKTNTEINFNIWDEYMPDVRLLTNINEILSWIKIKYVGNPEDT